MHKKAIQVMKIIKSVRIPKWSKIESNKNFSFCFLVWKVLLVKFRRKIILFKGMFLKCRGFWKLFLKFFLSMFKRKGQNKSNKIKLLKAKMILFYKVPPIIQKMEMKICEEVYDHNLNQYKHHVLVRDSKNRIC